MIIDFSQLDFSFNKKPLVVGGKAMEYYDLRKSGNDTDLIVVKEDISRLIKKYPKNLKNLWGDLGVSIHGFEIWKTIRYFDYDFLAEKAIEEDNCLLISLDKLLLQKAIAMEIPKFHNDLELIVKRMTQDLSQKSDEIARENIELLSEIKNPQFIEKKGV